MDLGKEIIDLTLPSDTPNVSSEMEDGQIEDAETPQNSQSPEKKRKRKRKKKAQSLTEVPRPFKIISLNDVKEKDTEAVPNNDTSNESNASPNTQAPDEEMQEPTDLFFIDTKPSQLPQIDAVALIPPVDSKEEGPSSSLLLPAHVAVFGSEPVEILPESDEELEEGLIEFLDSDRQQKDMVRYFDTRDENEKPQKVKIICKHCGREGHKAASCSVIICLTCGVRNEHGTRSCPIGKTCFHCGMKGHISATCPNRGSRRRNGFYDDGNGGCDRCGSDIHKTNECPTLWRLYDYMTAEGRDSVLKARQSKRDIELGKGGEGYVAVDEWCFNCGGCGHWGDDCQDMPHLDGIPDEPSAFSSRNLLTGPFSDETDGLFSNIRRQTARREADFSGDWGKKVPDYVGKQARQKQAAKLDKRARQLAAEEDDPDDWFGKRSAPDASRNKGIQIKGQAQKISFGRIQGPQSSNNRDDRRSDSKPSLLARMSDQSVEHFAPPPPDHQASSRARPSRPRDRNRDRDRDRDRGPRRDRDSRDDRNHSYGRRDHQSEMRAHYTERKERDRPRYRGGYS